MSTAKKKRSLYPLHLIIGFGIMVLFWLIPPIDPITPLGMRCVGAFLSMVYLWSAVDTLWPSMVGLFALAISGYGGDAGFNGVWMVAIGTNTVLLTLFAMILFGGMDAIGDTKYIAKWFLTRKIFKGRPVTFLAVFYALCFVLASVCSPYHLVDPALADLHEPDGHARGHTQRPHLAIFLRWDVRRLDIGTAALPVQGC